MSPRTRATLLVALAAVIFLAVLVATSSTAHADPTERTVTYGPVRCHDGGRCAQWRTVTTYTHGQATPTLHQKRTRPVEARTPGGEPHWSTWRTRFVTWEQA